MMAVTQVAERMRRGLVVAAADRAAQVELLRLLAVRVSVLEPVKQPSLRIRGEFPIATDGHHPEGTTLAVP
jgi:hypothetical protein